MLNNITYPIIHDNIDGLVKERHNSIANTMVLRPSCTNPSIYDFDHLV